MNCSSFGQCGSCQLYQLPYREQVAQKVERLKQLLAPFDPPPIGIYTGPDAYFRSRAEFRIYHKNGTISYAMREKGNGRKLIPIEECHIVKTPIYRFMPKLLSHLNSSPLLRERLYEIHFLTNYIDEILVTLIYHKKIDKNMAKEGKKLKETFPFADFIFRKKGRKYLFNKNYLIDQLEIGGEKFRYKIVENTFSQPNPFINRQMVNWVIEKSAGLEGDLVELYCGNGNFTIPLAKKRFRKVIATEINRESVDAALFNIELNRTDNITFLAMGASQFAQIVEEGNFLKKTVNTILVDPPRAGLDLKTELFVDKFENIIYISCNPESLVRNLKRLTVGRKIVAVAFFDQFPYTPHIETGVILKRSV